MLLWSKSSHYQGNQLQINYWSPKAILAKLPKSQCGAWGSANHKGLFTFTMLHHHSPQLRQWEATSPLFCKKVWQKIHQGIAQPGWSPTWTEAMNWRASSCNPSHISGTSSQLHTKIVFSGLLALLKSSSTMPWISPLALAGWLELQQPLTQVSKAEWISRIPSWLWSVCRCAQSHKIPINRI